MRWAGLALLAVMPFHVALRPEHGWLLLSACDVATVVTAVGLIAGWHRAVAIAGLFQLAVGLPSFAIGLFTTNPLNPTSAVIHIVPPALAAIVIARHGLPARSALLAWCGYGAMMVAGYLIAPTALNINLANKVWPPLADVFTVTGSFQGALLAVTAAMLATGEVITRAVVARGRGARPARS